MMIVGKIDVWEEDYCLKAGYGRMIIVKVVI